MKKALTFIVVLLALSCYAEAQIIGATNRSNTTYPQYNNSPEYRPTGPSLRFAADLNIYGSAAFIYQITPSFMIGGGAGVTETWGTTYYTINNERHYYKGLGAFIPVFFETEIRTPKFEWSLFLNVKAGTLISIGYKVTDPFFVSAMAGFSYKYFSMGGGISTGKYNFGILVLSISYDIPFSTLNKILR